MIATGGLSIPKIGATDFGYRVATQFGLPVLPCRPGLVSLTLSPRDLAETNGLSGTSAEARVSCRDRTFREAILFTHHGLSGPAILQISNYWEPGDPVTINLLPDLDLTETIKQWQKERPKAELKTLIGELSCPDRIPQIEVAVGSNAAALVFRHLVPLTQEDRERLAAFGEHNDIRIYLQPSRPDSIVPLWPAAPEPLFYRIPAFDLEIRFAPADFIQINDVVNAATVAQVLQLLEPGPQDAVLDLFCGLGNFTLPLARQAGRVLGVEGEAGLVNRARANSKLNQITNAEFISADLYRESSSTPWGDFKPDKLLLDPPRGGAIEAIKMLVEPLPSKIVYVSCYPATLARDSEYLVHALGYRFAAAGVMDMFPQTSHVETMALYVKP